MGDQCTISTSDRVYILKLGCGFLVECFFLRKKVLINAGARVAKKIDMTSQRYGRLLVIKENPERSTDGAEYTETHGK